MIRRLLLFIILTVTQFTAIAQINHWETAVNAQDAWKYSTPATEPESTWTTNSFDDSSWLEGQGSIGYGDNDDNTIIAPATSIYMRRSFYVMDKTKIDSVILHADYDDGFVAYLNGIEIARANVAGSPPLFNSWATQLREAEMYNGGLPETFALTPELLQNALLDGENTLAIQTHNYDGISSSDLTTLYWLSFGIIDASFTYGAPPAWFSIAWFQTELPIIKINTWGNYIPDEPKVQAELGIVWNGEGTLNNSLAEPNEFLGNITIERRGQSSLYLFPKNGFSFETKDANWVDMDVEFLNFPAEEDWILHGPYSDKSLMRNVLAMEIASRMGQYASRTRFVELIINDSYEGVYVLMERIKRDKNRVDIAKLNPEDIAGDELTGGYIIKVDKGEVDWFSDYDIAQNPGYKLPYQFVSPKREDIRPEQAAYIKGYMADFEKAMLNPTTTYNGKRYDEYIDLKSFAEHFLISELTRNVDGYRLSTYMYKDKDSNGGLLKAGPVWDYNLGFGNADYCDGAGIEGWMYDLHCDLGNPFWWHNMFMDERFLNTVKCRWEALREGPLATESLMDFIDTNAAMLTAPATRNFQRWPILDEYVWPNAIVTGSYQGEIDYLKQFLSARLIWMDRYMFGNCVVTAIDYPETRAHSSVYPNPANAELTVYNTAITLTLSQVVLINTRGEKIEIKEFTCSDANNLVIDLNQLSLPKGIYILELISQYGSKEHHRIIIE